MILMNLIHNKEQYIVQKNHLILALIFIFALFTKSIHFDHPDGYIFDEIYCGFTAEQYAENNMNAWVWDSNPPKGLAYNWVHPPLGGLIISGPIRLLGKSALSRRIIPLVSGILISMMVFQLGVLLFPEKASIALLAAAFFTLDGLGLVLSRISLIDTLLTLFIMLSTYFAFKKSYFWSAVFFGMAFSTKWTSLYLTAFFFLLSFSHCLWKKERVGKNMLFLLRVCSLYCSIAITIYLLSYLPMIVHFGFHKWWDLQKQMLFFHLNLKATHDWQSSAWTWAFDYRPVWIFVKYEVGKTRNIYALGNPLIFWGGVLAFFYSIGCVLFYRLKPTDIKTVNTQQSGNERMTLLYLLLIYSLSFFPLFFSPRIMFLYHYLPAIPFLCLILAFSLQTLAQLTPKLRSLPLLFLLFTFMVFIFFYPYWTGIAVPNQYIYLFHWLKTWGP
ncbi:Predicted membrane-bound dolichyl-phosphate-mannose-protein mannosyltransferase [Legionella wadsworthii]|uniref:Polyprenol-phosphate-mannose--protein mannosyltransferase n=1 Tax=Legionella wadsworthii TaxID=28088 RepID=A0A378LVG7_9GAMM|nr:glycosyltransferase family 39 protein [Legionella wadsworthii]STY29808.1 Predicted membrane-bound dolichyl-phosphate-mannose-protein mannosyltransferase [Legionella wadsworthii]